VRAATRIEVDGAVHDDTATVIVAKLRQLVPGCSPWPTTIAPDDGVFAWQSWMRRRTPARCGWRWRIFQRRPDADAASRFYRAARCRVSCEPIMPVEGRWRTRWAPRPMAVELYRSR